MHRDRAVSITARRPARPAARWGRRATIPSTRSPPGSGRTAGAVTRSSPATRCKGAPLAGSGGAAAGSAAAIGGGIIGGALAGAAGSIVSQGFGVATGLQQGFSWKGVALSALGGAVGGGIGQLGKLGSAAAQTALK